jgi:hypothetical protein
MREIIDCIVIACMMVGLYFNLSEKPRTVYLAKTHMEEIK